MQTKNSEWPRVKFFFLRAKIFERFAVCSGRLPSDSVFPMATTNNVPTGDFRTLLRPLSVRSDGTPVFGKPLGKSGPIVVGVDALSMHCKLPTVPMQNGRRTMCWYVFEHSTHCIVLDGTYRDVFADKDDRQLIAGMADEDGYTEFSHAGKVYTHFPYELCCMLIERQLWFPELIVKDHRDYIEHPINLYVTKTGDDTYSFIVLTPDNQSCFYKQRVCPGEGMRMNRFENINPTPFVYSEADDTNRRCAAEFFKEISALSNLPSKAGLQRWYVGGPVKLPKILKKRIELFRQAQQPFPKHIQDGIAAMERNVGNDVAYLSDLSDLSVIAATCPKCLTTVKQKEETDLFHILGCMCGGSRVHIPNFTDMHTPELVWVVTDRDETLNTNLFYINADRCNTCGWTSCCDNLKRCECTVFPPFIRTKRLIDFRTCIVPTVPVKGHPGDDFFTHSEYTFKLADNNVCLTSGDIQYRMASSGERTVDWELDPASDTPPLTDFQKYGIGGAKRHPSSHGLSRPAMRQFYRALYRPSMSKHKRAVAADIPMVDLMNFLRRFSDMSFMLRQVVPLLVSYAESEEGVFIVERYFE